MPGTGLGLISDVCLERGVEDGSVSFLHYSSLDQLDLFQL